jgi:hypothetical protein
MKTVVSSLCALAVLLCALVSCGGADAEIAHPRVWSAIKTLAFCMVTIFGRATSLAFLTTCPLSRSGRCISMAPDVIGIIDD